MADSDTITIDSSALSSGDLYLDINTMSTYSLPNSYSISSSSIYVSGAAGSSGSFLTSAGANGTSWSTISAVGTASQPSLNVTGEANFECDVKIKGVSISKTLEDIQKRLAILVPDPAKLEHFEALKKAYEHYKTLEALCEIPKEDGE
jgi:hypothetical protein